MPTATRFPRGGDLTKVPKAADTPPADLAKILSIDSSNPNLRSIRIQNGYLRLENLPVELRSRVPVPFATPGERP